MSDRRDRDRDGGRRRRDHEDVDYRRSSSKRIPDRERNSSRERPTRHHQNESSHYRDRDRSRDRDRERDRDRDRPPPRNNDRHHRNNDRNNDRDRHSSPPPRPRDPVREAEWDNFFNPNTNTSSTQQFKRPKVEDEDSKYGKKSDDSKDDKDKVQKEKEKPNFGLSGKLTEETNTFRGVVIKYSEPPEARKPQKIRWRLYPFKGSETLPTMFIHRQSAYLLGRDRKIADIPIDHPSCSKQHAVIQYRLMNYERSDGSKGRRIKPYVIDLESGNGTFVNGNKIDPKRYVELFEKDVLKFGFSSREYVLLHEHSKDEPDDDEFLGNTPELDDKVKIKIEKEEPEPDLN